MTFLFCVCQSHHSCFLLATAMVKQRVHFREIYYLIHVQFKNKTYAFVVIYTKCFFLVLTKQLTSAFCMQGGCNSICFEVTNGNRTKQNSQGALVRKCVRNMMMRVCTHICAFIRRRCSPSVSL